MNDAPTSDTKRFPGWLKGGCIGCLALAALGVLAIGLGVVFELRQAAREPEIETVERSIELPGQAAIEADGTVADGTVATDTGAVEQPPGGGALADMPDIPPIQTSPALGVENDTMAGRLVLDLSAGTFVIRPGEPGEPMRLEADFDTGSFEVEESFDSDDTGGWIYRVSFGPKGGFFGLLRGKENRNHLELVVPRGRPLSIEGDIGLGRSEIDLGGLWLDSVDLELGAGEHELEFSEPTRRPLELLQLKGSMGELTLRGVGNASPKKVAVEQGFGESSIDLRGPWLQDSEVDVDFGFGACRVRLPEGVRVEVERGEVSMGEQRVVRRDEDDLPPDAPTLVIRASGSAGELRID